MSDAPDFVGVTQPTFDAMVDGHTRAVERIGRLAQVLWGELTKANLDPSPAIRIRDMTARLREQSADLRRRQRLVHEMERQKINFGLCTPKGTRWRLPDRLETLERQLRGAEAADLARRAARGDRGALGSLTGLGSEATDPAFASAFLGSLGAEGLIELPAALAQRLRRDMDAHSTALASDEEGVQKALTVFAKALSVGTNPRSDAYVGDSYLEDLREQGRADHRFTGDDADGTYAGYQSLATLLSLNDGRPPLSLHFTEIIGRDMIAYDREHRPRITLPRTPPAVLPDVPEVPHRRPEDRSAPIPDLVGLLHLGWALTPNGDRPTADPPARGRTDFLNGLLHAAAFSREGARTLLNHTPAGQKNSDLEYLLHERRPLWAYTDHGTMLGQALKSAMSGHDETSRRLFKETSELLGRDIRRYFTYDGDHRLKFANVDGHADDLSGLRPGLGQVMCAHLGDVGTSISADAFLGSDGKSSGPTRRDIDALLAEVSQDDHAFSALVWQQIGRTRALLDQQYAEGGKIDTVLVSQGTVIGHLLAMRREALVARGKTVDAANQQIKNLIGKGVGLIPVPYGHLFGGASRAIYDEVVKTQYRQVGDWLSERVEWDGGAVAQDAKAASDEQATVGLLRQMALSAAIGHANITNVEGEPFAENGKILSPDRWVNDPEKVDRFVAWCDRNDFAAPRISQALKSAIENSHDDAVGSFQNAGAGELRP